MPLPLPTYSTNLNRNRFGHSSSVSSSSTNGISRPNPSFSATGISRPKNVLSSTGLHSHRKNILSATPQQKLPSNFNTLSCNSKFLAMSERKYQSDKRPDDRPLHKPEYHEACIKQISEFCSRNNYDIKISTHSTMSVGEMEKLFTFILSFYEIKIKEKSFTTEIIQVMESLGYPYHINRSSLQSYTTAKSKGVVLSLFVYLIEPLLLERKSVFSQNRDDDYNLEILKLILNRNQDEKDDFIKRRMNQQLMKKNELESLIKHTEELKNESYSLDNQDDQLKKLRENVNVAENQLQDFKRYEDDMKTYVQSSSKENEELKKKIEQIEQEISTLNNKKLDLELKIKEQKHSVDEMNYYIQRDKQVQIEIHKMNEELKKARQEYFQEKLKQDELFDNLKELFFKLTSILRNFKTDLPDAHHLQESCLKDDKFKNLLVFINNPDFDNNEIKFDLDLYTELLKSLKQSLNNDLLACKEEICKFQTDLESSLTRIKQLEKKNDMIVEQKQAVIQNLEQKKIDAINQIKNKKKEIEDVKSEINAIDNDVKLKRKMAMNENIDRKNKFDETKKDFNNYWASIRSKTVNLQSQLVSILPIQNEFQKEKERAVQLNTKLNEHLNNEHLVVENLINNL